MPFSNEMCLAIINPTNSVTNNKIKYYFNRNKTTDYIK